MNERDFERDVESVLPFSKRILSMTEEERNSEAKLIFGNVRFKFDLKHDSEQEAYWDSVRSEADRRIKFGAGEG